MQVEFKVKVNKFDNLELIKHNADKSATVPDTSYRITGSNGYDEVHTADTEGKIKLGGLRLGDYEAVKLKQVMIILLMFRSLGLRLKLMKNK